MKNTSRLDSIISRRLKLAHQRQFNNEDWQQVAVDLCDDLEGFTKEEEEEIFNRLSSSPDPGCECGFCATAPWRDYDYGDTYVD